MDKKKRGLDNKSGASILLGVLLCFVMVTVYMISNNASISYALPEELDAANIKEFKSQVEFINDGAGISSNEITNSITVHSKFQAIYENYILDLFCLQKQKNMPDDKKYVQLKDSSEYIDEGISYIVNFAYKDKDFEDSDGKRILSLSDEEYYKIQSAIWIYQDIKKPDPENSDVAAMWESINKNHASGVAKEIYDLVMEAQRVNSSTGVNAIEISNGNPEFTLSDDKTYYETSPITVSISTKNANTTFSGFKFEINSNTYDTKVVDENGSVITDLNSLADGKTFKIQVDATNLNVGSEANITGKISGVFTTNSFLAYEMEENPTAAQVALLVTSNKTEDIKELKAKITVPDTGVDYSKYVYIIGAMVLVIGLSVIYVNAKARQQ